MLRTLILAVCMGLALAGPQAERRDDWVAPSFCKGIDCPRYTVLEANNAEVSLWYSINLVLRFVHTKYQTLFNIFGFVTSLLGNLINCNNIMLVIVMFRV